MYEEYARDLLCEVRFIESIIALIASAPHLKKREA